MQSVGGGGPAPVVWPGPSRAFDVGISLRLVPQFCERDPDTFFSLFERVAEIGLMQSVHYCCSGF